MKQLLEKWNKYLKDNRWKYHILNETAFSRVVTDYGELGYIIITSDRTCEAEQGRECSEEEIAEQEKENAMNMDTFLQDIRSAGFGYLPVYGGYKEYLKNEKGEKVYDDETGEAKMVDTDTPENSVIVALRSDVGREGNTVEDLKKLGMGLSRNYNQDSFFFKPPNDIDTKAYYLKPDGSIDLEFTDFTINDLKRVYYTQMKRGPKHRFTALDEEKEMFFRVRTSPTSTAEARQRYGEYFMKFID
tara:strand:+ start:240 stop:974 length:735 start_codon:yes stop_codon:yes gene_type:complete